MTVPTSPTSSARPASVRHPRAGFTLVEVSLSLAIFGLLAALALPSVMPARSTTDLRIRAYQIAAVMRADRNAAARAGREMVTVIDAGGHLVRSGATGGEIPIPEHLTLRLEGTVGTAIRFAPDGRSSGGAVHLSRDETAYVVRADAFTGAVTIRKGEP